MPENFIPTVVAAMFGTGFLGLLMKQRHDRQTTRTNVYDSWFQSNDRLLIELDRFQLEFAHEPTTESEADELESKSERLHDLASEVTLKANMCVLTEDNPALRDQVSAHSYLCELVTKSIRLQSRHQRTHLDFRHTIVYSDGVIASVHERIAELRDSLHSTDAHRHQEIIAIIAHWEKEGSEASECLFKAEKHLKECSSRLETHAERLRSDIMKLRRDGAFIRSSFKRSRAERIVRAVRALLCKR